MLFWKRFANHVDEKSVASQLRRQRFHILLEMIRDSQEPVRILDIGGTPTYWEMMTSGVEPDKRIHVTLLNLTAYPITQPDVISLVGDGRYMPQFTDGQFDVVYSNSTIEHLGTLRDQKCMANEVRRIGKMYYIQTPNRNFPIEPHFIFPFFQFLPIRIRVYLAQRFNLGWYSRFQNSQEAYREVSSIRLLNRGEVAHLFPEAVIHEEKILGLVKSFVAYFSNGVVLDNIT